MENNKFGLSRKTNVAIAGIAGIAAVQNVFWAIAAVVLITVIAITYQFALDCRKNA